MAPRVGLVGIDLSLRAAAAVYLPPMWKPGGWKGIKVVRSGSEVENDDLLGQVMRLNAIVSDMSDFIAKLTDRPHVYIEDYAYGLAGRSGIKLAELGGALKREVYSRFHHVPVPVNIMTARKFFLGKVPQGKGKAAIAVHAALADMGWPFADSDPGDALVIASYARTEHGLAGLTLSG